MTSSNAISPASETPSATCTATADAEDITPDAAAQRLAAERIAKAAVEPASS